MQHIGILPNLKKDPDLTVTKYIAELVRGNDCKPLLDEKVVLGTCLFDMGVSEEDVYKNSDFLIVLGGDGTILEASHQAAIYNKPILGINIGTLGYLTDVEKDDAGKALELTLDGKYKTEKRIMLEATIFLNDKSELKFLALNDVCLLRGLQKSMIDINVYVEDELLDTYRADGIIVSTPTGSTAYNLSAGGPILKADAKIVAITPICPHNLHARSIIIDTSDVVTIKPLDRLENDILVAIDGEVEHQLKKDEYVKVKSSDRYTLLIKTNERGFYDVLREKMVRTGGWKI